MFTVRRSADRGHFDHGWLDTYHTFSFGDYHDPRQMGFRALRVINEDRVKAGAGFGMHPHRDMEIITCILSGALEHKDSLGSGSIIRPDDLQRMTAGTGILHSEFNPSPNEPVHLLQIWLLPRVRGLTPSYEEKKFPAADRHDRWQLVASEDGRDGSLSINQDVRLFRAQLDANQTLDYRFAPNRYGWLQVAHGRITAAGEASAPAEKLAAGERLAAGDGLLLENESSLRVTAEEPAELLLFDLG